MTKDEALKLALETLESNKQTHYYCEDTWYSCPQHEDGCANESAGDECNCGADEANAEIDKAIAAIYEAFAQPEQEPVAWATEEDFYRELEHELKHIREEMKIKTVTMRCKDYDVALPIIYNDLGRVLVGQPCIPPQRTWVVFPTMLRKMWSGSEVQAWLDENVNKENT